VLQQVLDPLDQPIKGAKAIAAATGGAMTEYQVFRAVESGHLPAIKHGSTWITTLRRLQAHFNGAGQQAAG
jgi:hypothetical protein